MAGHKPGINLFFAMCWVGFVVFYVGKIVECAIIWGALNNKECASAMTGLAANNLLHFILFGTL